MPTERLKRLELRVFNATEDVKTQQEAANAGLNRLLSADP